MPRSIAASTVRRNARVPSRWPSLTGSPRAVAQRPFPSRMIATERGTSSGSTGCCARPRALFRNRTRSPDLSRTARATQSTQRRAEGERQEEGRQHLEQLFADDHDAKTVPRVRMRVDLERLERLRDDPADGRREEEPERRSYSPKVARGRDPGDSRQKRHRQVEELPVDPGVVLEMLVHLGNLVEREQDEEHREDLPRQRSPGLGAPHEVGEERDDEPEQSREQGGNVVLAVEVEQPQRVFVREPQDPHDNQERDRRPDEERPSPRIDSERKPLRRVEDLSHQTSVISASLRLTKSSILLVCSSVAFWTRSSARRSSSSPTSPFVFSSFRCLSASRLTLRTATLPSSAIWRTIFTSSLRRSSVSCGIGRRITLPSFDGVRPSSDSWIARSISLIELGSNGCTVSMRGSGTLIVASWLSGVFCP